jgi:exopolyphosphatase/guanosine-5'-triphosphate,3'-diphosphate pyrophosphatase
MAESWPSASRQGAAVAALDLGSNNCRLLIAELARGGGLKIIDSFSRIVRLAEGLAHSGRLSEAAMARTEAALAICVERMQRHGVTRYWAVATEACRAAVNGAAFLDHVQDRLGLTIHVIKPQEEVSLAVAGCLDLVDRTADAALLIDIGGGSTEFAWIDSRAASPVLAWASARVGVVGLAENTNGHLEAMREAAAGALAYVRRELDLSFVNATSPHFIGTSGTVTSLAGYVLGLARYNRLAVDGLWLTREQVEAATATLSQSSLEERANHPCIGPGRADLVLAGAMILEQIWKLWPVPRIRVADRGLREGLLLRLLEQQPQPVAGAPR